MWYNENVTDGDTDARSLSQDAQEVLRVRAVKMLEQEKVIVVHGKNLEVSSIHTLSQWG